MSAGEARAVLWNQFILSRSLARVARGLLEREPDEVVPFCFMDTHAGCGHIPAPLPGLAGLLGQRHGFSSEVFFDALCADSGMDGEGARQDWHPGSWVLAGRVLSAVDEARLVVEIDVNDIDPAVVAEARRHREGRWTRFWSHDWFQFLRSRLGLSHPPRFVFIDPPANDARGPGFAIDAAILLDTLAVPYLVTYGLSAPQEVIDQIGRSGLELTQPATGTGCGVLLGGGAENVLLDILPDLRKLAAALDGVFSVRLPGNIDYTI